MRSRQTIVRHDYSEDALLLHRRHRPFCGNCIFRHFQNYSVHEQDTIYAYAHGTNSVLVQHIGRCIALRMRRRRGSTNVKTDTHHKGDFPTTFINRVAINDGSVPHISSNTIWCPCLQYHGLFDRRHLPCPRRNMRKVLVPDHNFWYSSLPSSFFDSTTFRTALLKSSWFTASL